MRMGSICCVLGGGGWGRAVLIYTPICGGCMEKDQTEESFFKALMCFSGPSPCLGLIHREGKVSGACLVHQDPRERREPGKCSIHAHSRIFPVCPGVGLECEPSSHHLSWKSAAWSK